MFSKVGLVDQSKPCAQIYFQKIASCINLQLPIVIFKNRLSTIVVLLCCWDINCIPHNIMSLLYNDVISACICVRG